MDEWTRQKKGARPRRRCTCTREGKGPTVASYARQESNLFFCLSSGVPVDNLYYYSKGLASRQSALALLTGK
jgi:hypothetical protein